MVLNRTCFVCFTSKTLFDSIVSVFFFFFFPLFGVFVCKVDEMKHLYRFRDSKYINWYLQSFIWFIRGRTHMCVCCALIYAYLCVRVCLSAVLTLPLILKLDWQIGLHLTYESIFQCFVNNSQFILVFLSLSFSPYIYLRQFSDFFRRYA